MGLMQKAVETYDCHQSYIGKYESDKVVLAPISHIITKSDIEITLNAKGEFVTASNVSKDESKILIPATESSAGRTSSPCAHPLCDQIGYIAPNNKEKYSLYVEQLSSWAQSQYSHPKLAPILSYVKGGTIVDDLLNRNLIELDDKGKIKDEKLFVRWKIINLDDDDACWQDKSLFDSFIDFYRSLHEDDEKDICMVSGEFTRRAQQHAKGIVALNGNAKLISANDNSGFTYRGRFFDQAQAMSVSYESSQKAHNALRWLVSNQGVAYGTRTFLCWNPKGKVVPSVTKSLAMFKKGTDENKLPVTKQTEYKERLWRTLAGYKSDLPDREDVVIAAFDAATSGRLSLTYYNELKASDFLQRIYDWDSTCCWYMYKNEIESPSLKQIIDCAFGTQQGDNDRAFLKTDEKVLSQQVQRLIACRVERAIMPFDIVKALFNRASNPMGYNKNTRIYILNTACAVIRKYYFDKYKEEIEMSLEENKADRSYQFGRLLAVMEKVERDTYDREEGREPNAVKQQSVFCQRPLYVASNIEKQLEQAYFPHLNAGSRIYYKNLMGEIMAEIAKFPQKEWNRPLSETYLVGYYLQRKELYTKKNNGDTEE